MGLFICILIFHLFNHAEIPCLTFLWCYTGMCNWYAVLYSVVVIRSRWREVTLSAGISMVHTSDRGFSFENQPSSLSLGEISAVSKPASRVGTAYSINWSEMQAFDNKLIDKLTKWTTWGTDKYKSFWNMYHKISFICLFVQIVKSVNLISSIEQI